MKQVLIRQGRVIVEEMPAPRCGEREILVRTLHSWISAGTEVSRFLLGLDAEARRAPAARTHA